MASEEELTSDSLDTTETDIPKSLLGYVRDQAVDYIKQTEFSAKIQHTQGQAPKLVLSFGNLALLNAKQNHGSSDIKNTNTILVENLPPTADEDLLEMFFESTKKYGGGPVKNVKMIRDKNMAYVKFCEASAVETVLKRKPIMLGTTELAVKPYQPLLPDNETIAQVDVVGLLVSKDFTEGLLTKYSEPVPTYGAQLAPMTKVEEGGGQGIEYMVEAARDELQSKILDYGTELQVEEPVVHKRFSWAAMASKNTHSMPPMNLMMTQPPPRSSRDSRKHHGGRESRERVGQPREDGDNQGTEMIVARERGTRFPDSQQLFVGNLPHNVSGKELRQFFGAYGTVVELRINTKCSGKVPNFGYVVFDSPEPVQHIMNNKPIMLNGEYRLNVEEKKPRGSESRPVGGGHLRMRGGGMNRGGFSRRGGW